MHWELLVLRDHINPFLHVVHMKPKLTKEKYSLSCQNTAMHKIQDVVCVAWKFKWNRKLELYINWIIIVTFFTTYANIFNLSESIYYEYGCHALLLQHVYNLAIISILLLHSAITFSNLFSIQICPFSLLVKEKIGATLKLCMH